jgi:MFS family permease
LNINNGFGWIAPSGWMRRYGPLKLVTGGLLDRVALHYYALSASVGALMGGILSLGNVVLKKSLHANEIQIALLMAIGPTTLLLGIVGSELVMGRDKRPFILYTGLISRGAFLFSFLCSGPWVYIIIAAVFNAFNSLMIPATTALWQGTVTSRMRNEYWGLTVSITTIISMVTAVVAGRILDANHQAYLWLFPFAGLMGMLSVLILAKMPVRGQYKFELEPHKLSFRKVFVEPLAKMNQLMREDKYYRHFEMAFFLYGVAFMIMAPVLPHYIVDIAGMNYSQASLCDGVLFQFGMIAMTRWWGRLMDRKSPMHLCAIVFSILSLFPGLLLIGPGMSYWGFGLVPVVYLGYLVYGIGMSGLGVAWNLAPIVFAGEKDASRYTGAHITITGIRGSLAPIIGGIGMKYLGYKPVLAASMLLFFLGAVGMVRLYSLMKRDGKLRSGSGATAS